MDLRDLLNVEVIGVVVGVIAATFKMFSYFHKDLSSRLEDMRKENKTAHEGISSNIHRVEDRLGDRIDDLDDDVEELKDLVRFSGRPRRKRTRR